MSDYKRLKHLAFAQPVRDWRSEEGEPSMMNGERMYYVAGPVGVSCWEHGAYNRASASYIAAANPAVVLELISENEKLKNECEELRESLTHAADEVESWGAYASDYFQQKHDLTGTVLKIRQAAASKESGQ